MDINGFFNREWIAPRNLYITHKDFAALYMRDTKRMLGDKIYRTIDIASIEASPRGTGSFTRLINELQVKFPERAIFVESVMNPRFALFLERVGFTKVDDNPPNFYLVPKIDSY